MVAKHRRIFLKNVNNSNCISDILRPWRLRDATSEDIFHTGSTHSNFGTWKRHFQQDMAWVVSIGSMFLTLTAEIVVMAEANTHTISHCIFTLLSIMVLVQLPILYHLVTAQTVTGYNSSNLVYHEPIVIMEYYVSPCLSICLILFFCVTVLSLS